jgi:hypothetical protein
MPDKKHPGQPFEIPKPEPYPETAPPVVSEFPLIPEEDPEIIPEEEPEMPPYEMPAPAEGP